MEQKEQNIKYGHFHDISPHHTAIQSKFLRVQLAALLTVTQFKTRCLLFLPLFYTLCPIFLELLHKPCTFFNQFLKYTKHSQHSLTTEAAILPCVWAGFRSAWNN